ncbi:MAG: hypothetical protein ABIO85_00825 [Sphingomicrobium sp.]
MAKHDKSQSTPDAGSRFNVEDLRDRGRAAVERFGDQTSTRIESMPLVALAGGLALGALIASVLPQTERELDLLEPAGTKLADAGRASLDKVREAGKAKVDELAGDKLRDFFGFGASSSANA